VREKQPAGGQGEDPAYLLEHRFPVPTVDDPFREAQRPLRLSHLAVRVRPPTVVGDVGGSALDDAVIEQHAAIPDGPVHEVVAGSQLRHEGLGVVAVEVDVLRGGPHLRPAPDDVVIQVTHSRSPCTRRGAREDESTRPNVSAGGLDSCRDRGQLQRLITGRTNAIGSQSIGPDVGLGDVDLRAPLAREPVPSTFAPPSSCGLRLRRHHGPFDVRQDVLDGDLSGIKVFAVVEDGLTCLIQRPMKVGEISGQYARRMKDCSRPACVSSASRRSPCLEPRPRHRSRLPSSRSPTAARPSGRRRQPRSGPS